MQSVSISVKPRRSFIFTPDAEAVARAKRIISAFEEADTGLVVIDGKLIEIPVLQEMHRLLAIAERASVCRQR